MKDNETITASTSFREDAIKNDLQQPARHGPSAKVEEQIQAAIDKRKQMTTNSLSRHSPKEPETIGTYEYLDHTADVQLHSWGADLNRALEQMVVAMFGYMTDISRVSVDDQDSSEFGSQIRAQGHDLHSLVFNFLQEWLYVFHDTGFLVNRVIVDSLDRKTFSIQSHGQGEVADWNKHSQGTEVKAVTYSCLRVVEEADRCDVWVIVDI